LDRDGAAVNTAENPSSKHQKPNKFQIQNGNGVRFGFLPFGFGVCLAFGAWYLELFV
jgi:hypothetical protein